MAHKNRIAGYAEIHELLERIERRSERQEQESHQQNERIIHILRKIEHEIARLIPQNNFVPAVSVTINQIGASMSTIPVPNPTLLSISPGNAPQFEAATQPVNAGPFVSANIVWSVTGDPGASVLQNAADPTGLTATLTLTAAVVVGAVLALTVVITNQDGSSVTATDSLTVVPAGTPPPAFVPATGVAVQQFI